MLERGARGPAVAAWQAALNDWLASADDAETRLVVDGVFGLRTEAVTRHFQSSSDVAVNGIVGPETAAAMRTEATSGTPSTPAAGACVTVHTATIQITLRPDTPDVRCVIASPDQGLEITNSTPTPVGLAIGEFRSELAPRETRLLTSRLGDLLEFGVHTVQVSIYRETGPQVWLR